MMDRPDPREALHAPPAALLIDDDGAEGAILMVAAQGYVDVAELGRVYRLESVWHCQLSAN